jgi:hypothetical protein
MLPKKKLNIYPKTDENILAVIEYYFADKDIAYTTALEKLKEDKVLALNQVEFMLRKLSEAYEPIFKKNLNGRIELHNLVQYGMDALVKNGISKRSKPGQKITLEFLDFVKKSEIDIDYLENNN